MRKILPYLVILLLVFILVVLIVKIRQQQSGESELPITRNNKEHDIYTNSSFCKPCSSASIIKEANEIIESPNVYSFRGGRSVNLADACKRYNCDEIIPLCWTKDNEEAKIMEKNLLESVGQHPKCDNDVLDGRGKTSDKGLPNFLYIKTRKYSQKTV